MERRHDSSGHKMSDFFLGFTDFFNLGRPIRRRNYGLSVKDDVKEALKSDWEQVGKYLQNALDQLNRLNR